MGYLRTDIMSSLVGPKCLFFAVAVLSVDVGIMVSDPVRPLHPGPVDTSLVTLRRLTTTGDDRNAVLAISLEQRPDDLGLDNGEADGIALLDVVLPTWMLRTTRSSANSVGRGILFHGLKCV